MLSRNPLALAAVIAVLMLLLVVAAAWSLLAERPPCTVTGSQALPWLECSNVRAL